MKPFLSITNGSFGPRGLVGQDTPAVIGSTHGGSLPVLAKPLESGCCFRFCGLHGLWWDPGGPRELLSTLPPVPYGTEVTSVNCYWAKSMCVHVLSQALFYDGPDLVLCPCSSPLG